MCFFKRLTWLVFVVLPTSLPDSFSDKVFILSIKKNCQVCFVSIADFTICFSPVILRFNNKLSL